ncbi:MULTISPECIES: DMT family transporter [Shinella]|jgi:small multidrug resistance pump|uniref:SMR family transporter n=1 Tax=Shinella sumterensis TaxID=1967501 RepID=A0AA50D755_9HYPH|nr:MULTISPECIES: SMR family transporter [Shinella]MDP9591040.1 small multidrug resistance pump [Shinella zoogloeoides]MCD1263213.1 QacE family quaternary ammonium compound efflux SMR transporter [Shinella sumterensis]TFE94458.1 QacE family quaternary ammonium compound efflux SMR transporter [Shinella sumterensis]UPA23693.1 QacE family quaternary ammonium compound efflux SMR transporter [Shinella oryzae]WLR97832.1 SMR family transporter [Shinella sumterensis]
MNPAIVYAVLVVAIVFEVLGTSAMQAAQHFTRLVPTMAMVVCYAIAFFFLSWSLRYVPVGIAYAIWSGLGIVLISLVGYFFFGQKLDPAALVGLGLIIAGVLVLNLFSKSTFH